MNIRDSYIHGADGKGVVKFLYFATGVESVLKADGSANYNTAAAKDIILLLADAAGTKVGLPIPTLNQNTSGYAAKILTGKKDTNASYYLTFVDSNNNSATAESVYTNVGLYFNPTIGPTGHVGTLYVNNISGDNIGITIGNTFVALGGTYTPATSITSSSDNNSVPGCKAVWDAILAGMKANDAMRFMGFLTGGTDAAHTAYTPAAERGDTYKVQTAGYINGNYYQVNDTFICTTDSTARATSSNVSTVKTNWGVVEGNGDYLNYNGGTMYGTLSWNGTTALPTVTTASSILVVDSNTTKQISLANLKTALNMATSAVVASSATGTTQITSAQTNPFYNLLLGGNVARSIQFKAGNGISISASTGGVITITNESPDQNHNTDRTGIYKGTVSGTKKTDTTLIINNSSTGLVFEGGTNLFKIGDGTNYVEIPITPLFTVTDKSASILTSLTTLATIAGTDIKAKVVVDNKAATIGTTATTIATIAGVDITAKIGSYAASNHTHSLSIATAAAADTNQITLAASTKYKLTAGGSTYIFTTPADTWRNIYIGGSSKVGTGIDTKAINFASSNINITHKAAGTSSGQSGNANYFTINFEAKNWSGATSSAAGTAGYMPGAASADRSKYLRGDGSWIALSPSISAGTTDTNKVKITVGGENSSEFTIPYATNADKVDNRHATGFVYWEGNPGKGNMNDIARSFYSATGMTNLSSSSVDNGDMSSWTHFFTTSYSDGGNSSNAWVFQLACPAGTSNLQFRSRNGGTVTNGTAWKIGWTKIAHAGNVSNKNATITTSSTTIATIAGVDIKAKIPIISAQASEFFNNKKTLEVTTWETIGDISGYEGTYAIQIKSGTLYASGIFAACGGTDLIIDEIPLHVSDSVGTWRPYARISGGNLQMTTNETTGVERTYIISIIKLI